MTSLMTPIDTNSKTGTRVSKQKKDKKKDKSALILDGKEILKGLKDGVHKRKIDVETLPKYERLRKYVPE